MCVFWRGDSRTVTVQGFWEPLLWVRKTSWAQELFPEGKKDETVNAQQYSLRVTSLLFIPHQKFTFYHDFELRQ